MNRLFQIAIKPLCLLVSLLLLSGCFERHRSTDSLCEANPQLCADTNLNDGQCRLQRTTLIWKRYDVLKNPTDAEKFKELKFTYDYQKCLEYAARIEPTELKERKTNRTRALLSAYDSIKRLNQELADSTDPEIIYYRWSQGDKRALRQFLMLEGTPALETPDMQLALATFYTTNDKEKTVGLLKHALELYNKGEKVKPEIIQSLATIAHQSGDTELAYLWSMIGNELEMQIGSRDKLIAFYPMADQKREAIDQRAGDLAEAIARGKFRASMVQ
ncbi:DUF2989 domain-containing protein [Photobacterium sanctipauli]|uniref:DUF2989 domain-containing protein n=1 Tax=Photobacterium sanctipauli TaxID=1342794 RepID=A0A2T3NXR6_9GAMM|nr:DUF2989 domain-containing protein [Photobacterium sanctipauli]PSW21032.1 DUF2989 domain-containing protein [Photobacterium sanctipauli]